MKKLIMLSVVLGLLGLLVSVGYSLELRDGYVKCYFLPLKDGKLYDEESKECGSYKKGEIYIVGGGYPYRRFLCDFEGKRLGYFKEEDVKKNEIIYSSTGDAAKLLQKEEIEAEKIYREENRKRELVRKEQERKEAEIRKARIAQFPIEIQNAINKKSVLLGMTQEQARLAWGNPGNINRTITKLGVHEQWVYGGHSYLYFEDGILIAIQN